MARPRKNQPVVFRTLAELLASLNLKAADAFTIEARSGFLILDAAIQQTGATIRGRYRMDAQGAFTPFVPWTQSIYEMKDIRTKVQDVEFLTRLVGAGYLATSQALVGDERETASHPNAASAKKAAVKKTPAKKTGAAATPVEDLLKRVGVKRVKNKLRSKAAKKTAVKTSVLKKAPAKKAVIKKITRRVVKKATAPKVSERAVAAGKALPKKRPYTKDPNKVYGRAAWKTGTDNKSSNAK